VSSGRVPWLAVPEKRPDRFELGATRLAARRNTDFNYILLFECF